MSEELLKNENFENLGGINVKVSPYTQGPHEFLDISNYDFSVPGALTTRPGSTQWLNSVTGATPITGLYEFSSLEGPSFIMYAQGSHIFYATGNVGYTLNNSFQAGNQTQFLTFVDRVFYCNGTNFWKWNGSTIPIVLSDGPTTIILSTWFYSLPVPTQTIYSVPFGSSPVITPWAFATYTYSYGFINDRGFHGAVSNPAIVSGITPGSFPQGVCGVSGNIEAGWGIPASFGIGISALVSYEGIFGPSLFGGIAGIAVYRDNGPGTGRYRIGYAALSVGSDDFAQTFIDTNLAQSNFPEPTCISPTLAPRYLEVYNNQLFCGGFSQAVSTVQFSDIGEPESVQPGNNFEVRTNDGDRITGFKSAFYNLYIFKQNSFHVLTGTDPTNFDLNIVSDQYGCISNKAICTYENFLVFLDKKGIVRYNGANIEVISTKIEPIFQLINLNAAYDNAQMVHLKDQNQILCAIPINGSLTNNILLVYDYLCGSWAHYDGLNFGELAIMFADQPKYTAFFSGYSGQINYFSVSLMSDNGVGISAYIQSRFIADAGQSVQKLYRQAFINARSYTGSTMVFGLQLFNDYGTTAAISTTLVSSQFQYRYDFGLSVKSLSVRLSTFTTQDKITIHGYALASRFLRNI